MKKILFLLLFCGCCQLGFGQKIAPEKRDAWNIPEPGADFIIAGGIYFGSSKTANYYSGAPHNELNLDYIFQNKWRHDEIVRLISDKNKFVSPNDSTLYVMSDGYPQKVRYQPAMSVCLGAAYHFDENWRIAIYYSFARLTAKSAFNVHYDNRVPGNENPQFLQYLLLGKENRSFFDLTGSYTFQVHPMVKPFVELGAQFNFVKVKSFDAVIEEKEFNLMDIYGGSTYVPGVQLQEFDPHYGGSGFAITATAGVKFAFNKYVSIDPCFYASFGKIGLNNYKDFHFNFGAYVRLVLSTSFYKS